MRIDVELTEHRSEGSVAAAVAAAIWERLGDVITSVRVTRDEPKIRCTLVGLTEHARELKWPEGWPVPTEGDTVELPGLVAGLVVRRVVWYPEGDGEDEPSPFVYLVIGPRIGP